MGEQPGSECREAGSRGVYRFKQSIKGGRPFSVESSQAVREGAFPQLQDTFKDEQDKADILATL